MHIVNGALGPSQGPEMPLQEVSTAVHSTVSRSAQKAARGDVIEGDHELYDRVIERVRTSGKTVRIEEVLGPLDEPSVPRSEAD